MFENEIKKTLAEYAKNNDPVALASYIKAMLASHKLELSHLNYALRIAAASNSTQVIPILIKEGADIHSQGPGTGNIALHFAIQYKKFEAAKQVLNSVDPYDYYDPVGQLLFKNKQEKTPLDFLEALEEVDSNDFASLHKFCKNIIYTLNALSLHPRTTDEDIALIQQKLHIILSRPEPVNKAIEIIDWLQKQYLYFFRECKPKVDAETSTYYGTVVANLRKLHDTQAKQKIQFMETFIEKNQHSLVHQPLIKTSKKILATFKKMWQETLDEHLMELEKLSSDHRNSILN